MRLAASDTRVAWIDRAALALAMALGAVAGFVRDFSGDFHWHVVLGERMLRDHALARTDSFSHTFAGRPQHLDSWLADVLLALAYRGGGYAGCYALRGACIALTIGLLGREMIRCGAKAWTAAVVATLVLGELLFRLYLRPETISFVCLAALMATLGEHQRTGKARYAAMALPLIALWSNLHGSVLIGLAIVGGYCLELAVTAWRSTPRDARALRIAVALPFASFAASCLSPEGLREPLMFLYVRDDDPTFRAGIDWSPLDLRTMTAAFPIMLVVLALTTLVAWKRTSWWRLLVVALLLTLACKHARFVKAAMLAGAPLFACNVAAIRAWWARRQATAGQAAGVARAVEVTLRVGVAGAAVAAIGLLFGVRQLHREVGFGLDKNVYPEAACRFVEQQPIPGLVLNSFDIGSYLLFCMPDHPVAIDQRAASLYTPEFAREYAAASATTSSVRALADRIHATWAFVIYDRFASRMALDPATWRLVYFDDIALIYVRADDPAQSSTFKSAFTYLEPARVTALPFLSGRDLARANEQLATQSARCPDCRRTRIAAAALAVAAGDEATYARTIAALSPDDSGDVIFIAAAHELTHGDARAAARGFANARARGADPLAAYLLEAQAFARAGDVDGANRVLDEASQLPGARDAAERVRAFVAQHR